MSGTRPTTGGPCGWGVHSPYTRTAHPAPRSRRSRPCRPAGRSVPAVFAPTRPSAVFGRTGAARSYRALLAFWPVRGFREAGAGHLSAILAYNGLVALVPTALLLVSVSGLLLRRDAVMETFVRSAFWALPSADARQALEAALAAKGHTGWFFVASLVGFLWIGSGFTGALNHCFNQVYGVPDGNFVATRQRGVAVLVAFVVLFAAVATAATLPTLFLGRDPGPYFRTWALAETGARALSYALAFVAVAGAFLLDLPRDAERRAADQGRLAGVPGGGRALPGAGTGLPGVPAPHRRGEPVRGGLRAADAAAGVVRGARPRDALRLLRQRLLPPPAQDLAAPERPGNECARRP